MKRVGGVLPLVSMVFATAACATARPEIEPCVGPAYGASVVTEDMLVDGDSALVVRVADAALRPMQGALVSVVPDRIGGSTDHRGEVRFKGIPRGRYEIRVLSIGYRTAVDSITYSEFGTDVAVVLVRVGWGTLACIRTGSPRQP